MTKQVTKTAVPRLRFPEFCNAAEWEWKTLSHVCDMRAGKFIAASEISERPDERSYPCYGGNGLRGYTAGFTHSGRFPLIGRQGALCGNIQFVEGDFYATEHALVASPKAETDVGWLRYTLDGLNLNRFATGQAQPGLSVDVLNGVSCAVPGSESEQQKIADCLASLDEVIAAQGHKVEALKTHKRGLMQQLFPREGETRPRLRFPEFRDAPEWVETTIGEVGNFYYGKSAPKWSLEKDAATSCVRYGELYTKFDVVITETISRTSIDPRNLRFSKGGEVLVPRVGEKPEDFGRCCCYLPLANVAIGEMISVFETDQNPLFYTYYFRRMYREFAKVVEGQNVKNLYYTELEPLAICRPSIEEQKVISDCLLLLDKRIASESDQLAALKTHKQGLMQQLLPAPEAATA